MSTWELELFPVAGGDSTRQSIEAWGVAALQVQFTNWTGDQASLQVRSGSAAFDAAAFAYRDKIVVWRDGARFFHGWVTGLGLSAEPGTESRTYTLSGPQWWLANLPFVWPFWPVKESLDVGERYSYLWIQFALNSAISGGAPIAKDPAGYAAFRIPSPDLRASGSCAEVVQRVARLFPMSAGWWDYSAAVPVFRAAVRAGLTAQSISLTTDSVESFGFTPRPDLQLESIAIHYAYPDVWGGTSTVESSAGTNPLGYGPNKLHCTIAVDSHALASEAQNYGIANVIFAGLSPLAWEGAVNLHSRGEALPLVRPGHALSLTGGLAEWTTMATCIQSVAWTVSAGAGDLCSISLGAPEHLGPQDYLELFRIAGQAGNSVSGNPGPYDPPTPPAPPTDDTQPGTIDDLNGATGGSAPVGDVIDQARGGVWAKVGFAEYTPDSGSSSQYARYRTKTGTGSIYLSGGQLACSYTWATTGTSSYGAASGTLDSVMHSTLDGVDQGERVSGEYQGVIPSCGNGYFTYHSTRTRTVLTEWMALSDGSLGGSTSGSHVVTLSGEDTADDAAARAFAAHPWSTIGSNATRTPESATLTGVHVEVRWGTYALSGAVLTYTPLTGLQPWTSYCLRRTTRQRPIDATGAATGDWVELPDVVAPFLTDLAGTGGVEWQYQFAPEGWEVDLGAPKLEVY